MPEDNNKQQLEDQEHKEVSSTQTEGEQQNATVETKLKEKENIPLPTTTVKPSSCFKLLSFTGDNSKVKISNWIRMYENMATRVGWSDEEMKWNLSSYLDEEAFDYYVEHVLADDQDWKKARQSMLTRFDQYEIEPHMKFLSYRWSPQMELKEYFKKMRAFGFDANLEEEKIIEGLIRGVPSHLADELTCLKSLEQCFNVAFLLQHRLDENHYHKKNNQWRNSGRGNRRNNNQRQKKPRMNHQQNSKSNQHVPQTATTSNELSDAQAR